MSDLGAAPWLDWTLRGAPFGCASFKWGLPLLPHLYETFSKMSQLPAFEVCMDRLLLQSDGSADRSFARLMAQKTDVCLFSRLANLAGEDFLSDKQLEEFKQCGEEIAPRWLAVALGFNSYRDPSWRVPLPVPRTRESADRIVTRIKLLQQRLPSELALVNVSGMFRYSFDAMSEVEFLSRICDATGVKFILDIPALFVSLHHQGVDFESEFTKLPLQNIVSVRIGALAVSAQGPVDAECGSLSVMHWGFLEDVLQALPADTHKAIFLKWFEPLVSAGELFGEIVSGQNVLRRLGEA